MVGRLLDGRYEILSRLARGGMATVYRAQDRRLTRTVAVKVMHDGLGDDADFARKFDREARSAATLSNPHVVSVFDQGMENGRPWIVMEFVTGCTLRHMITREAPLPPLRALDMMESLASALASAHEAGLVHRDVKPENVLISDRGQVKVADFGLARAITAQTATATQGLLIGTVSYLPPELVTSGRADARSDVYSAGVVLFEMLTGKKPHAGETPIQVAYSHVHNDIPAPSTLLAGNDPRSMDSRRIIPPYLDELVVACTRRDPALRPRDGRELLHLVRQARKALGHGILDDPQLTGVMGASMRAAEPATAVQPAVEERTEVVQLRQAEPALPASGVAGGLAAAAAIGVGAAASSPTGQQAALLGQPRAEQPHVPESSSAHREPVAAGPDAGWAPRSPVSPARPSGASAVRGGPDLAAERRRRVLRRRRAVVLSLLTLLLALGLALGAYWYAEGRYTAMPALTSARQAEAQRIAGANGFTTEVVQQYSETVPKGTVISTDPAAGEKVLKESTVEVVVSRGPERHAMPSLVGLNREQASKAITDAQLVVGEVGEKYSETVPAGIVATVSQSPGTSLKPGTRINLVMSKGPQPVPVEDFTGKSADQARTALQNAGFTVKTSEKNDDKVAAGRVISQDPREGLGKKGDTITLVVSKGPVMVAVPAVAGQSEAAATKALKDKGFQVSVVHATPEWLRDDKVKAASPTQGKLAKQGSTVTLWVI
ncbi:hypothetical protein GCM10009599_00630 [Luteococcus peritonei]